MTIKRTTVQSGPFERGHVRVELSDSESFEAAVELIKANSPAGRISTWRPHADRLGVAGDLLDQAEALIDQNGRVEKIDRFDALMAKAEHVIEQAQHNHLRVYDLAASQARHNEALSDNARKFNAEKAQESQLADARLVELDDAIQHENRRLNQVQRAEKILEKHSDELPSRIAASKPESLAKRIRKARK